MDGYGDPGADPRDEWRVDRVSGVTAEEYRTAAKVMRELDCSLAALKCEEQADRLEAESARDEEAETLAREFHKGVLSVREMVEFDRLDSGYRESLVAGVRAVLDRLAADGRVLPEGGVDWRERAEKAEAELEEVIEERDGWEQRLTTLIYTFATEAEVGEWSSGNELDETFIDHMHGKLQKLERLAYPASTPPAVSASDSYVHNHSPFEGHGLDCPERVVDGKRRGACMDRGPDGTPEKPWPRVEEISEGTWFRPKSMPGVVLSKSGRTGWFVMTDERGEFATWRSVDGRSINALAPFVRVDGDQA